MNKLCYFTLATVLSILGFNNIKAFPVNAAPVLVRQDIKLAQKSAASEDEMLDALQERQEKLEKIEVLKNLTKNQNILDALSDQNIDIQNAEELEAVKDIVNDDSIDNGEILSILQKQQLNIQNETELAELRALINGANAKDESFKMSQPFAFKMLTIGLPSALLVLLICLPIVKAITKGVAENVEDKIGKPAVPEGSINLHHRSIKEISTIATKAQAINNDKFGNREFKELIMFKVNISKKTPGYPELNNSVELLKAAIIAQKSFLKLESTELRYRSRKQQEFYKYVADNLEGDIDKEAFAKKIKKKQAEVMPLINSEEGREAINSYVKELNVLSQHDLGLKLFSLFKQYDLQDFSVLKRVSDVVESLHAKELFSPEELTSLVLENYEAFEKLAPILGISEAEATASGYARVLQILGLMNRHGNSYLQFKQLIELLKKWEKPYKHIAMVRKEYTADKYKIPPEFKEDVPGITIYQQYAEHLTHL